MGIVGAAAGVGLGFAGAAIIAKSRRSCPRRSRAARPALPADDVGPGGASHAIGPTRPTVVGAAVPVGHRRRHRSGRAPGRAGGLLAGAFGSWRIARLRPADGAGPGGLNGT